jgi:hypothetical protein
MACRGGAKGEEIRFATDSLLEGDGFEPSVPRDRVMVFARTLRPDSFPERDPPSEPFSLHPQNLLYRCAVIDRQMSPQTGEAMTKSDRRPGGVQGTVASRMPLTARGLPITNAQREFKA